MKNLRDEMGKLVRFPPPESRLDSSASPAPGPRSSASGSRAEADPEPVCPRCRGAGYYVMDVLYGNPNFARAIKCDCRIRDERERAVEDLRRLSDLDPFLDKRFDNFDHERRGVGEAFALARRYADDPYGWLVFVGTTGCGKTHLAAAIANEVIARRMQVLFAVVPELLDGLRNTFAPDSGTRYSELIESVQTSPLLILDDLGTEYPTAWAGEKLYLIFNHRYNNRLPTVVTMNPRAWAELDERVKSRMTDAELVRVMLMRDAGDFRPHKSRPQAGRRSLRPRR
jgi:DNA replication protein DnaC